MQTSLLRKYDKQLGLLVLFATCIWSLFFLRYGIDETDSAYYIANFKYFFGDVVYPTIATELSFLFGGLLYKLNPFPIYLGFRIFDWMVNCATWVLLYRMLKDTMPRLWLGAGLFIGSLLIRRYPMMLGYNSFSFLFFVWALYLMQEGIVHRAQKKIGWSGFLIGFNVFFRIPNVLQAFMVFIPILYALADKDYGWKWAWKQALYFTCTGFIGLFLSAGLCIAFEGWDAFWKGILLVFNISQSGSHAPGNMLEKILFQITEAYYYFGVLKYYVLLAFLLPLVYVLLSRLSKATWYRRGLQVLTGLACLFLGHRLGNNLYIDMFVYSMSFLALLSSVLAVFLFPFLDKRRYLFALMLLLFIFTVPVGTDNGVMQFCLVGSVLIAGILVYLSVFEQREEKQDSWHYLPRAYARLLALMVSIMFFVGAVSNVVFQESYRQGELSAQTTAVNVPHLEYMRTMEWKAKALEDYYRRVSNPALADRGLAVTGLFPMAHILTDHRPVLRHVWSDLKTTNKAEMLALLQAEEKLPIILLADFDDYVDGDDFRDFAGDLKAFAETHNYEKYISDAFVLYTPLD